MALLAVLGFAVPERPQDTQKPVRFADVLPIFKRHCVSCHTGPSAAGGLALDSFAGTMRGGVSGASVVVGKASASALIVRVKGEDGKPRMPMGFAPLDARDIATLEAWIQGGALDGGDAKTAHWAYVAPVRPVVMPLRGWGNNAIDAFVLTRLVKEGLKPSPQADKATLIRRVTLDLTGLPPSTKEVDAYVTDTSSRAYEKVVDRLLASPHYGEKMALPWLDAARYADSNGFQQDGDTYQYVWRDWVVKAMNANLPFDRFTTLQLAGDLLPGTTQATPEGRDALVATGFNRNHMLNGEGGAIAEEQRNVNLADRVDTTSTTWMGLTMACARCHDHKYDPLSQKDYFKLVAFFNNVPESGVPQGGVPYSIAPPWIYAGDPDAMKRLRKLESDSQEATRDAKYVEKLPATVDGETAWRTIADAKLPKEIRDLLAIAKPNADQSQKLHAYYMDNVLAGPDKAVWERSIAVRKELDTLRAQLPKPMVMSDANPRVTHLLSRGDYTSPLEPLESGTPETLPAMPFDAPANRLGLAAWIVGSENPLTSRVQVNRAWQTFFGLGLVRTPENFGVQGEAPTHPALLDWLAVEFRESGWNVKRLHRLIVTSATYRQSSKTSAALRTLDPSNALLARGARFRLPSMLLRDGALAASGLINLQIGGRPVYPYQVPGIWDGLSITKERDFTYPQSKGSDLYRRSLYTFWGRTAAPGNMFDSSSRQVCTVRPSQTSTPLHALTTLNDTTWVEAGRALAQRVMLAESTSQQRLTLAFRLVCVRRPDASDLRVLQRSLQRAMNAYRANPKDAALYLSQGDSPRDKRLDPVEHAAYAAVCLAILTLDEALTKE